MGGVNAKPPTSEWPVLNGEQRVTGFATVQSPKGVRRATTGPRLNARRCAFVFVTIGAAWLLSHRNRGDAHKGLPYESGIDTYGDTHARFGLSFYLYALLFVAFDIEVIFIYLWALVFRDVLMGGFVSMLIFVGILLLGLAYAWRKGVLTWH